VSSIRSVRLADGESWKGHWARWGRYASATPVVFGEEGFYLLGSVTMEELGLAPDPVEKRLKPTEALLM